MKESAPASTRPAPAPLSPGLEWLNEGGELGRLIAAYDWASTPLGSLANWPQSLRTSVSLMLSSQHPMWIGWGPESTFLYNDAYISVLSLAKHPGALGQPAAVVWSEIWDFCGPLADKVFQRGEASYVEDVELIMNRGNWLEETYYSFSYSPIRDEAGNVGGLFCPSAEVSSRLINARRLRTLSELTASALLEKTVEGACASAFATLKKNSRDLPFAVLYLLGKDARRGERIASLGLPPSDELLAPGWIDLDLPPGAAVWPIRQAVESGQLIEAPLPPSATPLIGVGRQPVSLAAVLPVTAHGLGRPLAVLVAGVNPARKLDPEYRTFYELIATQLATAIQNASAAEEERKRLAGLAELDRAKIEFFSNVSHEFRTPLTLMLGPLEEELRESAAPNPRLDLAYRNSLRLLKLVNTLLDFSRIEAGRMEASFEATDLSAYTAELASVFQSAVEKAGLRLIIDCPPLPLPAFVDRTMWEKIVFNFLSNAFKFTFQGEIEVKLRAGADQSAVLTVRDTGAGIPAAELPRLFERFHRGVNTQSRSYEGTGIGLSLVQELVQLHGGTVVAASTEGVGTTFTVTLPLGSAHLPGARLRNTATAPSVSAAAKAFVVEADHWLAKSTGAPTAAPEKASLAVEDDAGPAPAGAEQGQILVCDDNNDLRDYLSRLLRSRGYEVTAVADGWAALAAARLERPGLVLSDVMMPGLDGFGLLRELRKDAATRTIPIILLSARAGEEARIEGLAAGADGYLTKPFSARELLAQIASQLQLAQVRREAAKAVEQERQRLYGLLMDSPALIVAVRGPDHVIELANPVWLRGVGRSGEVVGRPFKEVLPELHGQGFFELLDEVYRTGISHLGKEERVMLARKPGAALEEAYFDYVFQATRDPAGAIDGIMIHAVEITDSLRARRQVEELAEELTQSNELLSNRSRHLDLLVEERTQKLQEVIAELEAFSYSIAHDLRSPLRSVQSFSEALVADFSSLLPEEARGYLRRIGAASERMDRLILDVLSYSRVVRGELTLAPVSVDKLVREIVATYPLFAPDHANIEVVGMLPTVLGNEAMLTQIVSNLLGNAVKFVRPGAKPEIRIWAEERGGRAKIYFADQGIGIAPDQLEKVFDTFYQIDKSLGGTGIGLAIVKKAVARLGGTLALTSTLGEGSSFSVELKLP